jgi:hypothetical protein
MFKYQPLPPFIRGAGGIFRDVLHSSEIRYSDDRLVWQFAQANQMVLLTANRSMKGKNSLEQVMREENTSASLPVVTIGDADRVLTDPDYRNRCVDRLIEIVFDIDDYKGTRRLFVP